MLVLTALEKIMMIIYYFNILTLSRRMHLFRIYHLEWNFLWGNFHKRTYKNHRKGSQSGPYYSRYVQLFSYMRCSCIFSHYGNLQILIIKFLVWYIGQKLLFSLRDISMITRFAKKNVKNCMKFDTFYVRCNKFFYHVRFSHRKEIFSSGTIKLKQFFQNNHILMHYRININQRKQKTTLTTSNFALRYWEWLTTLFCVWMIESIEYRLSSTGREESQQSLPLDC